MTVDVNIRVADEQFLENIDEIMEETMVQIFILQPRDYDELTTAKEQADEYTAIFYCAPLTSYDEIDNNCVGFYVDNIHALEPVRPFSVLSLTRRRRMMSSRNSILLSVPGMSVSSILMCLPECLWRSW
jgi:hypothetical protein